MEERSGNSTQKVRVSRNLSYGAMTHATGQTYPRFSREALDGEGVCLQLNHSQRSSGGLGLTVNQRGISK